tara:strand:+ start:162 stop:1163 length:1002 start_codon:yes stop_codon:yes gene_type:complete
VADPDTAPLLRVEGLTTEFRLDGQWHSAIRNLSFSVDRNETLAIVGESGCGKSITVMSLMRLLPEHGCRLSADQVNLNGQDLMGLSEDQMRSLRGNRMAMIFQEPMTALNPVLPIGLQIAEPMMFHRGLSLAEARPAVIELLDQVGIPSAAKRVDDYPHEFSGGMRQRVVIAMALACDPDLLLADEPTTALDVTIQAQVLALLADLKAAKGMGMILITHSLGVVAAVADRVAVMYAGDMVETAGVEELFANPVHPYTEALIRSIPRPDRDIEAVVPITGTVPSIDHMPAGCRFAARCSYAEARCVESAPPLASVGEGGHHVAACWVRAGGPAT